MRRQSFGSGFLTFSTGHSTSFVLLPSRLFIFQNDCAAEYPRPVSQLWNSLDEPQLVPQETKQMRMES